MSEIELTDHCYVKTSTLILMPAIFPIAEY